MGKSINRNHTPVIPVLFCLFGFLLVFQPLLAQSEVDTEFEEVTLLVTMPQVGNTNISAVLSPKGIYLSIVDLFLFLKIKMDISTQYDSISGFYLKEDITYLIDLQHEKINVGSKEFLVSRDDFIRTEDNIYMRIRFFGPIFGLKCTFLPRMLSVHIETDLELPIVREMKRARIRENLKKLSGIITADHMVKRRLSALSLGMADWSLSTSKSLPGPGEWSGRLAMGAEVVGGDFDAYYYRYESPAFTHIQDRWRWRYVDNDFRLMRQARLGKINVSPVTTLSQPMYGLSITNTPSLYRRAFGSYVISDYTEPEWIVEVYVNNVLVDFSKADPSGFYRFEIPLSYGTTSITLKFYGPWGEERSLERYINIPFTFLPAGEFEYVLSAGQLDNDSNDRFSQFSVKGGVAHWLTFGAGAEYLSGVEDRSVWPFTDAYIRLSNALLWSAEYTHGVKAKSTLNFSLPSHHGLVLSYTRYDEEQTTFPTNNIDEKRLSIYLPFYSQVLSGMTRFSVSQNTTPTTKSTYGQFTVSAFKAGLNANISTFLYYFKEDLNLVRTSLSLSFRAFGGFLLRPQAEFDIRSKEIQVLRGYAEKRIFENGWLLLSLEKRLAEKTTTAFLNFRYDFPFAQINSGARSTGSKKRLAQSARGTVGFDQSTKKMLFGNRTWVRRGGFTVSPYLDVNHNDMWDREEPRVSGLGVGINGGTLIPAGKDTVTHVANLELYRDYLLSLDASGLENVVWKPKYNTVAAQVAPNQFREIPIPVVVLNEVNGRVTRITPQGAKGQGRITVMFQHMDSDTTSSILSEFDGNFYYLGLTPGIYAAYVDPEQLRKLKMDADPHMRGFQIRARPDGDIIQGIDFVLRPLDKSTPPSEIVEQVRPTVRLNDVFFDFNKHTLRPESYPALDGVVSFLNDNPEIEIELSGHTDYIGTDQYNLNLSNRRAREVCNYFISKGISSQRVTVRGYGEKKPIASNATEEGRQLNRRVEFTILTISTKLRVEKEFPERKIVQLFDKEGDKIDEVELFSESSADTSSSEPADSSGLRKTDPFFTEYYLGLAAFNRMEYREALDCFESLIRDFPRHELVSNCHYWSGECLFGMKDYDRACRSFERTLELESFYKSDDALLMLGRCYDKMGNPDVARSYFLRLLDEYPESEYVSIAKQRVRTEDK